MRVHQNLKEIEGELSDRGICQDNILNYAMTVCFYNLTISLFIIVFPYDPVQPEPLASLIYYTRNIVPAFSLRCLK
jgi:hypothetical protein